MRFVVDTNVLISALLKPGSVPDRLLAAIAESGTVLFDVRITDEYAAVLGRPKFGAIDRGRVASLLAALRAKGEDLGDIPPWNGAMTDSDDRIFIEAAS